MLHQAYQRLKGAEKTRINNLLQQYLDNKASKELKEKIDSYKTSEPGQLLNEMHSIFGTEAGDLPPELEAYYNQYFTNRQKVLALHQSYRAEFDQRIQKIDGYDRQLTNLKGQIESDKADIEAMETDLRQKRLQLNAYLADNQIAEYNAAVPSFNAEVVSYRSLVAATNKKVDRFNRLLATRNALAVQERQLEAAIDSNVKTANEH